MTNTIYRTPPPPVMPPGPEQAPKPPRRHRWVLPAAVVAALLLGGGIVGVVASDSTGTGTARPQPTVNQRARPANPVPILSRTGARVPSGTVYGEVNADRDRYATGYFRVLGQRDAEQVTVYTFATKADMHRYLQQNPPSDTKIGIRGSGLYAVQVVGMLDKNKQMVYSVTPTQIAHRVDGTLIGGPRSFKHVPASKPKQHIKAAPPTAAPAQPAPPTVSPNVDPVTVVQDFYDALARGDYPTAWALGGKNIGGMDYNSWVAAYATTAGVYGTASDLGGGVVQVSFSAVQSDGSVKTFAGTYTVSGGVIVAANIKQTS